MRYILTIIFSGYSLLAPFISGAQPGWEWGIKNTGRGGMTAWPSAVDGQGNLYLAGSTYGSAFTLDSMVFGTHTVPGSGAVDQLIITKTDTAGNYVWALGSMGGNVGVSGLVVGPSYNVYVVGSYSGSTVTLGAITLTNSIPSYSMNFIAKISSAGTVLWAENMMNNQGSLGAPIDFGIGVDGVGNAYVTGNFYQYEVLFGSTILTNHDPSGFTGDILLVKYNSAGLLKWATSIGGDHEDYPYIQGNYAGFDYLNTMMSVTPAGHIYLTGLFFSDSIKIGATTLYNPSGGTTSPGPTYSYICKWDSSGNAIWAKNVNRRMLVNEITSDAQEQIFFAGNIDSADTWGSVSLNPGALVAKMDSAGNLLWAITDSGGDAKTIGLDTAGNILVAGNMADSMSFSGHVLHAPAINAAPMFAAEYNSSGTYIQSVAVAGGAVVSNAIRPDNYGNFYLVGNYFDVSLTFGPDVLDTAGVLSETTFIARYGYTSSTSTTALPQYPTLVDNILLYPNPVSNILNITCTEKITTIATTNLLGQTVCTSQYNATQAQVDVSALPAGVYFVRVNGTEVRKFVKQ